MSSSDLSDDFDLVPQPPDPTYVRLVAAFIRGLIQIASGIGFTIGAITDNQILVAATAIVAIATFAWSFYQKILSKRHAHQMAMASALVTAQATVKAGEPTPVPVVNKQQAQATVQALVGG